MSSKVSLYFRGHYLSNLQGGSEPCSLVVTNQNGFFGNGTVCGEQTDRNGDWCMRASMESVYLSPFPCSGHLPGVEWSLS